MKNILFVNSLKTQCGVYEYGNSTFRILNTYLPEYTISKLECPKNEYNLDYSVYDLIIVNFHPLTLPNFPLYENKKYLVIEHDDDIDFHKDNISYVHLDPTFTEHDKHYKVGRFLTKARTSENWFKNRIGTFGFGTFDKNYMEICDILNASLPYGEFYIHIPANSHIDDQGVVGNNILAIMRHKLKREIAIISSREYLTTEQLIYNLSQNEANILCYSPQRKSLGCSSALDIALSAKRPVAVNNSIMFRQLLSITDDCCLDKHKLWPIIERGTDYLKPIYDSWTEENLAKDYKRIIELL